MAIVFFWVNSECWTLTDDVHEYGGVFRNFTTVEECKTACANNYTCVAIGWNPNSAGNTCWIQSSTVIKDRPIHAQTDIRLSTHYELERACLHS